MNKTKHSHVAREFTELFIEINYERIKRGKKPLTARLITLRLFNKYQNNKELLYDDFIKIE